MKKILSLSALIFSLNLHAQVDTTEMQADSVQVKLVQLPDSTAVGAPDGKPVSKEIGAAGGTIISDDGRMELLFPAGALTAKKTISIQPIVNLIPNGNGKGYQFEPSGLHFIKPVEIIFHYTQEEEEVCPPELKFMGVQDHNGKWEYMNYDHWDSTKKSLRGHISHFSSVMNGNLVELSTVDTTLKVGKSFSLNLTLAADHEASPLPIKGDLVRWFLESGRGSGTLRSDASYSATYTAPNYLPGKDPKVVVTISKTTIERVVQRTRHKSGSWSGETRVPHTERFKFTCDVKLYDEYRITIIKKGPSTLRCGAELEDRSSFSVKFYPNKKPEITDVTNAEPTLTKLPDCRNESRGGRKAQYTITYDPAGCQGPVHVSGNLLTGYGMMSNDQTITPPDITIEFVPSNVKIMNGKIHYPGTPGASTNHHFLKRQQIIPAGDAKDEPANEEDFTVGNKIQFKGNREHQEYSRTDDVAEHSFQLVIDPI